MSIEIVTMDELQIFKRELISEIEKLLQDLRGNQGNRKWLRTSEVRVLLGLSAGTLQNLRINGTLPYTRLNGVIYYNSEDIDLLLENNKTGSNSS